MALLNLRGKKVNVIDVGQNSKQGDTIIMVHGLCTNLFPYYFFTAPKLSKSHRVILYDLRGHGSSEWHGEGFSLDILSDELLALMDELEIQKANLVGHSYGGGVSLYTAIGHPDRVNRLALIEMPLFREKGLNRFLTDEKFREKLFSSGRKSFRNRTVTVAPKGKSDSVNAALEKKPDQVQHGNPDGKTNRMPGENMSENQGRKVSSSPRGTPNDNGNFLFGNGMISDAFRLAQEQLTVADLKNLSAPTLLLYGRLSYLMNTGRILKKNIPDAKFRAVWGDHNLHMRRSDLVCEELKEFFR